MLRQYGDAFTIVREIQADAPQWLAQQQYARDVISKIIAKRRTLTEPMRDMADFLRVPY
jgi:hypothetical protein